MSEDVTPSSSEAMPATAVDHVREYITNNERNLMKQLQALERLRSILVDKDWQPMFTATAKGFRNVGDPYGELEPIKQIEPFSHWDLPTAALKAYAEIQKANSHKLYDGEISLSVTIELPDDMEAIRIPESDFLPFVRESYEDLKEFGE